MAEDGAGRAGRTHVVTAQPDLPEAARADETRQNTAAIRSGAVALAGGVVAGLGGFLLTVVVARGLGASRAGVFFVSVGIFMILANTLELGADTGLVREIPRLRTLDRPGDIRRTLWVAAVPVLLAGAVAASLVTVFADPLANVFMRQGPTTLGAGFLRTIAPFLVVAPLATVLLAGTRGFGAIGPLVGIQNIAVPIIRPLAIWTLVLLGAASEQGVALAWGLPLVGACVAAVAVLTVQTRRLTPVAHRAEQPAAMSSGLSRQFWSFAAPRGFAGAADITLVWLDVVLVGWLVGPREAGIYAAASRFVTTGTLALQASRVAIAPRLSALLTLDHKREAERLHQGAAQAVVALSWPLYLGLVCFAPVVLRIFGSGFTGGASALAVLSAAMLASTATGNIGTVLLMGGRSRWNMTNSVLGVVLNLGLNLLLIPRYGITGAAVAWAVAILAVSAAACTEVHFLLGVRTFSRGTGEAAVAALTCCAVPAGILLVAFGERSLTVVVWMVVAGTAYSTWLWRRRSSLGIAELAAALPKRSRTAKRAR